MSSTFVINISDTTTECLDYAATIKNNESDAQYFHVKYVLDFFPFIFFPFIRTVDKNKSIFGHNFYSSMHNN